MLLPSKVIICDFRMGGNYLCLRKKLSALLNGKSGISPEMALRLSKVFGRTPEGWLRLQHQYDLWKIGQHLDLSTLSPIQATQEIPTR